MTGWNLPPGCNVRDIPGNRPEDEEAEAFADAFSKQVDAVTDNVGRVTEDGFEKLCEWAWQQMGEAYGRGYVDGMADEAMARDLEEEK